MSYSLELKAKYLEDRINQYARLLGRRIGKEKEAEYLAKIDILEAELAEVDKELSGLYHHFSLHRAQFSR